MELITIGIGMDFSYGTIKVYLHNILNYRQLTDFVISYEELTESPQACIDRVCDHLEVREGV